MIWMFMDIQNFRWALLHLSHLVDLSVLLKLKFIWSLWIVSLLVWYKIITRVFWCSPLNILTPTAGSQNFLSIKSTHSMQHCALIGWHKYETVPLLVYQEGVSWLWLEARRGVKRGMVGGEGVFALKNEILRIQIFSKTLRINRVNIKKSYFYVWWKLWSLFVFFPFHIF